MVPKNQRLISLFIYLVQTFLAVGLVACDFPTIFIAVPLKHLILYPRLNRFAFLRDSPFGVNNLLC